MTQDEHTTEGDYAEWRDVLLADAIETGLLMPCSGCGNASFVAYNAMHLVSALDGFTRLDPTPTHLCTPPASTTTEEA